MVPVALLRTGRYVVPNPHLGRTRLVCVCKQDGPSLTLGNGDDHGSPVPVRPVERRVVPGRTSSGPKVGRLLGVTFPRSGRGSSVGDSSKVPTDVVSIGGTRYRLPRSPVSRLPGTLSFPGGVTSRRARRGPGWRSGSVRRRRSNPKGRVEKGWRRRLIRVSPWSVRETDDPGPHPLTVFPGDGDGWCLKQFPSTTETRGDRDRGTGDPGVQGLR